MGNWSEIFSERQSKSPLDELRGKYLKRLAKLTGRNVIAYYSGWLQNSISDRSGISDDDMNDFMAVIQKLDREKGLDLLLHTPGGDIAATEAIVKYLKSFFDTDIRAIIPQLAMSAGTMMACSCKEIIMGRQSNLGPIDPQFRGIPCQGVLEEFNEALDNIRNNPGDQALLAAAQIMIGKYHPTFVGDCEKAISWSNEMVTEWLETSMFKDENSETREHLANQVVSKLGSHKEQKAHNRHISAEECKDIGLKIMMMEENQALQDAILSVHHAFMISLAEGVAPIKIVENQRSVRMMFAARN